MNYSTQINKMLDIFFDKKGDRYCDIKIFDEIFDFMANSDFKEKDSKLYEAELLRIRDLHNSFVTAYEKAKNRAKNRAKIERNLEVAINGIKEGLPIELITKLTGLTAEEINALRNE